MASDFPKERLQADVGNMFQFEYPLDALERKVDMCIGGAWAAIIRKLFEEWRSSELQTISLATLRLVRKELAVHLHGLANEEDLAFEEFACLLRDEIATLYIALLTQANEKAYLNVLQEMTIRAGHIDSNNKKDMRDIALIQRVTVDFVGDTLAFFEEDLDKNERERTNN